MYYHIVTYGCQMNVHESEKIAGMLFERGYTETNDIKNADIIIFNTCCIREGAETKALGNIGAVKNLKKKNPNLIIAVLGCMPQRPGSVGVLKNKYSFIDIILGTHNLSELGEKIDAKLVDNKNKIKSPAYIEILEDSNLPLYSDSGSLYRTSGTNAWINIIYGCNNFCTYCIVPFVRGREKSRPMKDIILEAEQLLMSGKYREITLLGQNVNSYGNDLNDGSNFKVLIDKLTDLNYDFRLKFMTSHPKDLSDEVIELIARKERMSKFIHLPVQSGSTAVLKAMNRKYTREDYLRLITKIKNAIPDAGLSSDVMVGFPGETEQDFLDTLSLIEEVKFDNLYMFVYSKRSGTAAEKMPEQIDDEIKTYRINKLVALQRKLSTATSKKYIGKTLTGLISEDGKTATSDNGKLILLDKTYSEKVNCFNKIKILNTKSSKLIGTIQ